MFRQVLPLLLALYMGSHQAALSAQSLSIIDRAVAEGRLQEAGTLYRQAIGKSPDRAELHLSYARFLQSTGQMALSMGEYKRCLQLDPKLAAAQIGLAQIALQILDIDNAYKFAQDALKLAPRSRQARLILVECLMRSGKAGRADVELSQLLPFEKTPEVLFLAYQLKIRKGDLSGARKWLEEAVKADPLQTDRVLDLCQLLESASEYGRSRQYLLQVLQRDPAAAQVRLRLARNLELSQGNYDDAIEQYKLVLQSLPDSDAAFSGLDRCRAKKNDLALQMKLAVRRALRR